MPTMSNSRYALQQRGGGRLKVKLLKVVTENEWIRAAMLRKTEEGAIKLANQLARTRLKKQRG